MQYVILISKYKILKKFNNTQRRLSLSDSLFLINDLE